MISEEPYSLNEAGIFAPPQPVQHRDDEFHPAWFEIMHNMQSRHFWYLGRHRFILHALKRFLSQSERKLQAGLQAVDLGGGCGGWIQYLKAHSRGLFAELALADSSIRALTLAANVVGPSVKRYQVDLLRLLWTERWDVAFLLDVLEHIPQDLEALQQIRRALRPSGLLIITTPALNFFWTCNDVLNQHVRRYSRRDFERLANKSGFELCFTRYLMFFLSPLLVLSRLKPLDLKNMTEQEIHEHLHRTHKVPPWPVHQMLRLAFSLETPLGIWLPFPWGASVFAVLRRGD
jgi:SAM-dependent methyltransferase